MCKEKFGIEMEIISKKSITSVTNNIASLMGADKTSLYHDYHGHNVNEWGIESDCSISSAHNYPYAMEIITPPMKINELGNVKKVLNSLSGKTKQISANKSCGLHIHVEVPNSETLKAILLIWKHFEPKILRTFPLSRRNNNRFCKTLSGRTIEDLINFQFDRYHMVNIQCYHSKGTVEFRGHAGTVNYNKIKRWVLFVTKLVEVAKTYSDRLPDLAGKLHDTPPSKLWDFLGLENTKTAKYMKARIIHFEKLSPATT